MDVFATVFIGGTVIVISIFGLIFRKLVNPEVTLKYKGFVLRLGESKEQDNE